MSYIVTHLHALKNASKITFSMPPNQAIHTLFLHRSSKKKLPGTISAGYHHDTITTIPMMLIGE